MAEERVRLLSPLSRGDKEVGGVERVFEQEERGAGTGILLLRINSSSHVLLSKTSAPACLLFEKRRGMSPLSREIRRVAESRRLLTGEEESRSWYFFL